MTNDFSFFLRDVTWLYFERLFHDEQPPRHPQLAYDIFLACCWLMVLAVELLKRVIQAPAGGAEEAHFSELCQVLWASDLVLSALASPRTAALCAQIPPGAIAFFEDRLNGARFDGSATFSQEAMVVDIERECGELNWHTYMLRLLRRCSMLECSVAVGRSQPMCDTDCLVTLSWCTSGGLSFWDTGHGIVWGGWGHEWCIVG